MIESVSRSAQLPTPNPAALPRSLAVAGLDEPHGRRDDKNGTVSRRSAVIGCKDQRVFWWDTTGFDHTLREAAWSEKGRRMGRKDPFWILRRPRGLQADL